MLYTKESIFGAKILKRLGRKKFSQINRCVGMMFSEKLVYLKIRLHLVGSIVET